MESQLCGSEPDFYVRRRDEKSDREQERVLVAFGTDSKSHARSSGYWMVPEPVLVLSSNTTDSEYRELIRTRRYLIVDTLCRTLILKQ